MTRRVLIAKIALYAPLILYILILAGAELAGVLIGRNMAMILHIILFFSVVNHHILHQKSPYSLLLLGLALCSLLRILSLSIIVRELAPMFAYLTTSIPLLLCMFLLTRLVRIPTIGQVAWRKSLWIQGIIVFASPFIGFIGYAILQPSALVPGENLLNMLIASGILILFNALMEELLFRRIIHNGALEFLGEKGILLSSAIYAVMGIGFQLWQYVLFLYGVSLLLSWCVLRSRSLWGVIVAHSLMSITMLVILPILNR
jgi:uncharacterized protein